MSENSPQLETQEVTPVKEFVAIRDLTRFELLLAGGSPYVGEITGTGNEIADRGMTLQDFVGQPRFATDLQSLHTANGILSGQASRDEIDGVRRATGFLRTHFPCFNPGTTDTINSGFMFELQLEPLDNNGCVKSGRAVFKIGRDDEAFQTLEENRQKRGRPLSKETLGMTAEKFLQEAELEENWEKVGFSMIKNEETKTIVVTYSPLSPPEGSSR